MEARVSALEAGLARIEAKLDLLPTKADLAKVDDRIRKIETDGLPRLATDLAEVKGRVSQLPTALAVFGYMGGLVTLTLALGGIGIAIGRYLGPATGH